MKTAISGAVVVWLALAAAPIAQGQQQAATNPTGLIVGRVVDASTDKPLAGVLLELGIETTLGQVAVGPPRRQLSNAQGRFVFRDVPAGRVTVRATVGGNFPGPNGFISNSSGFPIGAYLPGGFGQRRPDGALRQLTLAQGQNVSDAEIRMWRSASLNGTVTDETGDPLVDVVVGAARVTSDGTLANGPTTKTDDRGMYRLSSLEPGRYIVFVPQTQTVMLMDSVNVVTARLQEAAAKNGVSVLPVVPELTGIRIGTSLVSTGTSGMITGTQPPRTVNGATYVLPTTFLPGSTTLNVNAAVEIAAGEDRTAADLTVRAVPTAIVSGTLTASGVPSNGMLVHLLPAGSRDAALFETAKARTDANGRFTFPAVPLGSYTVVAFNDPALPPAPNPSAVEHSVGIVGGPGAWGAAPVSVGAEGVANLQLAMRPGFSIRGRMDFEGSSPRPDEAALKNLRIDVTRTRPQFRSIAGAPAMSLLDPTQQFAVIGVTPARYTIRPSTLVIGPWRLKSVQVGGREVADLPVEISEDLNNVVVTFTDQPASLVFDVAGADADDGATFMLFLADRAAWSDLPPTSARLRGVRLPTAGGGTLPFVLPGDYLAVAVSESLLADFPSEVLFTKLAPLATAVRVTAGQRTSVSLTLKKVQ